MSHDHGYPNPEDVTPEVQAMIDSDTEARIATGRIQKARVVLGEILRNDSALERLGLLLEQIDGSEDGENIFASIPTAGEVLALLANADTETLEEWLEAKRPPDCALRQVDEDRTNTPEAKNHPDGPVVYHKKIDGMPEPGAVWIRVNML